jgi:nucleolar pre-ribosomal-associated protein 1
VSCSSHFLFSTWLNVLLAVLPRKSILVLVVRCLLRLSLSSGASSSRLSPVVTKALKCLRSLEEQIELPSAFTKRVTLSDSRFPRLHGAHGLHEPLVEEDPVQVWGEVVESLWRVTLTLEVKLPEWDALTCRLLVWRSMVGETGSEVGEWARKEVVRNLCLQSGE